MNVSPDRLRDPEFIKELAEEIFKSHDDDNDGFIDREELVKFINYYSAESGMRIPTTKEIDQIVTTFDKNNDNRFSLEEFTNFIRLIFDILASSL